MSSQRARWIVLILFPILAVGMYVLVNARPDPSLRILVDGKPAVGVKVTETVAGAHGVTDETGLVPFREPLGLILLQDPRLSDRTVQVPEHGRKTLDIRGRRTIVAIESSILGFTTESTFEMLNLTAEEIESIGSGETTSGEVRARVRSEGEE